ncbi:uncharacterized protein SPSK_00242 [Sporothrix schenckii 1099-18]|uniref:Uncharacterized protein n=1 Tax=Sporothrix schenckii 1099-18 TaxID=1397361 RepID=A0A0F2M2M1_SPOSC|nr:uncharacterized protein SPSK_00242 [Sporothrix schenckii 1099-18]KJR83943.1 hypothetical protein SPSK_00242 [Sporothrix schenckii 1099-18]
MSRGRTSWPAWLGIWLFVTDLAPAASASNVVEKLWDTEVVRRVEKIHVTTELQFRIRAAATSTCPTSYSLCPGSLSGGCCPTDYACEVSSCVQTALALTASACGRAGYMNCGIEAAGGCCPSGYICGVNDCTAPTGVSSTQQCPTGYYLCPASYNFGCCETTMGCALNACYATTPATFVFTATFTTSTSANGKAAVTTVTSTTVEIPTAPTDLPTDTNVFLPKFIPAIQAKASEVAVADNATTTDNSSSGLTGAQIGGLVGGLVGLLLVVLVAAFFIIRNLRKTAEAVKKAERGSGSSSAGRRGGRRGGPNLSGGGIDAGGASGSGESGTRNSKQRMAAHLPTPSEINQMEYDDLLENQAAETHLDGGRNSAFSQPPGMSNLSGSTPPMPDNTGFPKASLDFSSPNAGVDREPVTGYFDIPGRVQNRPGRYSMSSDPRTSVDSQGQLPPALVWSQQRQQYHRPRIVSDASERSARDSVVVGSPLQPAELGVDGGFIPELPSVLHSPEEDAGAASHYQNQGQIPQRARPFSNISALSGMGNFGAGTQLQQHQHQQQQQPLMSGHQRSWSDDSNNGTPSHTPAHSPGQSPGHTPSHSRDRSNIYQQVHHQSIQHPQPFQPQPTQAPKLDVVSEAAEHMHGHYGPINAVAGQTRAAADVEIDISSPVAP